jgi:hypothetical protein
MSDYQITITNHPSIADDPTNPGQKLYKDGKPVPLVPSHRCARFNGRAIAYANADSGELKIQFFGFGATLPPSVKDEAVAMLENEFGKSAANVAMPIQPPPPEDE